MKGLNFMQISNNNSPTFTCIHVRTSAMTQAQKNLSNTIADILNYSDEYQKAGRDIDVYFLPGKSKNSLLVRFADNFTDNFYRTDSNKILQTKTSDYTNKYKMVDDIREKLAQIIDGKFRRPQYNETQVINAKTDVAKLRPELYEDIREGAEELEKTIGRENLDDYLATEHLRIKYNTNKDSEF